MRLGLRRRYGHYLYWGLRYQCPFCGGRFRALLPLQWAGQAQVLQEHRVVGAGPRDAVCPRCRSYDRERLVYLYLTKKAHVFRSGRRLLHVAPERTLREVFLRDSSLDYLTIDLESPLAMRKMDVTNLDLDDDLFDVILCNHVLEHVSDDRKAMAELFRVLKPGGCAILQVPIAPDLDRTLEDPRIIAPADRERAFGQSDHVRLYGAKDYRARLEAVGFTVELYRFADDFGVEEARKFGLLVDEELHVCRKLRPHA